LLIDTKSEILKTLPDVSAIQEYQQLRAIAYSTAESFDIAKLRLILKEYKQLSKLTEDVIAIEIDDGSVYIFENGTMCTWGVTKQSTVALLEKLKGCEINPYYSIETEYFDYINDQSQAGGLLEDDIIIGNEVSSHETQLVFSFGLTRSVKLASLELCLENHLERTKHVPEYLTKNGIVPLNRQEMMKTLGELFLLRGT
jgi:uncharacterized Rmd1/YagE family protein